MTDSQNPNDPLFDEEPQGVVARLLPPLVLICAFGGFVALAIYAYKAGTQSVGEGELMVIEADSTPVKEKPEDPGGMQFPNQDKTVFETFSSGGQQPQVERVLPTPEEPIPAAGNENWINDKLATATPAAPQGAEQVFGVEETPPAPAEPKPAAQVKNVQEELAKQAVAEAPVTVAEVPVAEAPKPLEITTTKETKKAPFKPKASAGKQLVQLGAYKTDAEAKADFAKMQKKYSALSGKSPTVNRADLGDKGVFYRLRVSTDDARALCSTLSASGQACMVVK